MRKLNFFTFLLLAGVLLIAPATLQAQNKATNPMANRLKVSYGDAIYTTSAYAILDALIGGSIFMNADEITSPGSFTLSYQRNLGDGRWSLGGDFGYTSLTEKMKDGCTRELSMYSVMLSTECYYIKHGIVRLYGTLGVGGLFTQAGSGLAFQFNPIAIRVGNNRIAGFAEAGIGMKGVFNVGLEIGF